MDFETIKQVLTELEAEGVDYVIFGAVALNLHGLARATEDLDIFIAPTSENVEGLKLALRRVFDDPEIEEISSDDLLGDYPAVQYIPPVGSFHLDILTRLGEVFDFAGLDSMRVDFDGLEVSVVTPRMLFEMKRDTVRWKDRGDAMRLAEMFGFEGESCQ